MVLVIMKESLPGAEKKKEERGETRRGTEIKIENETGTERVGKVGTGTGRGTRIGKETGTGTVIDITEIATGTEVREGNVEETGMMMMMITTAAGTMKGNAYE